MSNQYLGGLITKTPVVPNSISAPGIWTLSQQAAAQATNTWPFPRDPQFNYVTMLLHGDGSAGAVGMGSGAGASSTVTAFNTDASTNNFNLAINGDARSDNFNPYQAGYYSNYFDGSGDYLTFPSNATFAFGTGDFTVEFWVQEVSSWNPAGGSNYAHWISINSYTTGVMIRPDLTGSSIQVWVGNTQYTFTTSLSLGNWYHIALSRSSSSMRLFVNGTQVGSTQTVTYNISTNTSNTIGTAVHSTTEVMQGFLSNLRIVSGTAAYTSNFTPSTTPLTAVSGTSLLTCQSNRFTDNSTNAFTITVNGNTAVVPAVPFTLPSSVATYGSGYFSGTAGTYLETPYNAALDAGTGAFTYEAWLNPSTTSNKQYLGGTVTNAFFAFVGSGTIFVGRNNVAVDFTSSSAIVINQWNHVVIVRNASNNIAIFINGTRQYYAASNTNNYGLASNPLRIGVATTGSSYEYNGYITDVKIAKSALYDPTSSTITVPTAPLTAGSAGLLTTQYNGAGNNSGFKDSSQNNFVITRNGNTTQGTFAPYGSNWSNAFATSAGVQFPYTSSLTSWWTQDFTMEMWIFNNTNAVSSASSLPLQFAHGIYNSTPTYWAFGTNSSGQVDFYYYNGSPVRVTSTTAVSLGTWNHIAMVYTHSSGNISVYLNGVSVASATKSGTPQNDASNTVNIGVTQTTYYNGYISNLRVLNGTALYTTTFTPSITPLTAITNTQLLTCQSNRFVDNSTNNATPTIIGSPSVQRFSPFANATAYNPATTGGSAYFDGTSDYLSVANNGLFGSGDWTLELWMNAPVGQTDKPIIEARNSASGSGSTAGFTLTMITSTEIRVYSGSERIRATANYVNQWLHIALVKSGSTTTMYFNGVSVGTTTGLGNMSDTGFIVGAGYYGSTSLNAYGNFYASNMRVVKGLAVYTGNFTPPTAPVTAIASTVLLMNYTNAGILDNAMMNDLETVGNAQISTSVVKYGTASMYFDGSSDRLYEPSNQNFNFGTGDFTIELWANPISQGGHGSSNNDCLIDFRPATGSGAYGTLYIFNSGASVNWFANGLARIAGGTISNGAWTHIAICRSSGSTRLFLNGVQSGSTYADSTNYLVSPIMVGEFNDGTGGGNFYGYIDDLRITKYARYTTTFTPPTAAFPNG